MRPAPPGEPPGGGSTDAPPHARGSGESGGDDEGDAIPSETAGPYPADGSNRPNVLDPGRRRAAGHPVELRLGVRRGRWRAADDRAHGRRRWRGQRTAAYTGRRSTCGTAPARRTRYSQSIADENYLRACRRPTPGAPALHDRFPGAYSGRWPHIHFEVFATLDRPPGGTRHHLADRLRGHLRGRLRLDGYSRASATWRPLASDNVFGDDGGVDQLATVTGSVRDGLVASLTVPV